MALPKMNTAVYPLTIPSSGLQISFRPFLVREEKALLIAQQSEDTDVMAATLKEVIRNCVKDPIDVNSLAMFDLEYLFAQIRAKSVGEEAELIFTCSHCDQEKNKVKIAIDLTKIEIIKDPKHSNKIPLFDDIGIIMKYPNIDIIKKIDNLAKDANLVTEIIIDCIQSIYQGDIVHYAKETSREELEEFVLNLTKNQFEKIEQFFTTIPKFKKLIEFDCPMCGAHNETVLEGLQSFF